VKESDASPSAAGEFHWNEASGRIEGGATGH